MARGANGHAPSGLAQFADYYASHDEHSSFELRPQNKTRLTSFGAAWYPTSTAPFPPKHNSPQFVFGAAVAVLPGLVAVGHTHLGPNVGGEVYLIEVPDFDYQS